MTWVGGEIPPPPPPLADNSWTCKNSSILLLVVVLGDCLFNIESQSTSWHPYFLYHHRTLGIWRATFQNFYSEFWAVAFLVSSSVFSGQCFVGNSHQYFWILGVTLMRHWWPWVVTLVVWPFLDLCCSEKIPQKYWCERQTVSWLEVCLLWIPWMICSQPLKENKTCITGVEVGPCKGP